MQANGQFFFLFVSNTKQHFPPIIKYLPLEGVQRCPMMPSACDHRPLSAPVSPLSRNWESKKREKASAHLTFKVF